MELEIKPYSKNLFPIAGILVKGPSVAYWLKEIQDLNLALTEIRTYPIPGVQPNSVWGCLLITQPEKTKMKRHQYCQLIFETLFIPEKALLFPAVSEEELKKLFYTGLHIMHPDFGLVALEEEIKWAEVLSAPVSRPASALTPADTILMPTTIKCFQVAPAPIEDTLKKLEAEIFPQQEILEQKPLNLWEKAKLSVLQQLFSIGTPEEKSGHSSHWPGSFLSGITGLKGLFSSKEPGWVKNLQETYEELEKRNQKEVDKLLDLLKTNPLEALKYALPLDNEGLSRGGNLSQYQLSQRWPDFSLFGRGRSGGSGSANIGDHYQRLRDQYLLSAHDLIQQQDYQEAAFIYFKLLKDYSLAAQTLEAGKFYAEAASIYLKYGHNKPKAAECYEKGNMTKEAIELYKELNENEKVGDLYFSIQDRAEAEVYFAKVIADYKTRNQYVKAALIFRNKMNNPLGGQSMLLEGWRANQDATNCLNNYFANIADSENLGQEIESIYAREVTNSNREAFLQVIRHEYEGSQELAERVRNIAYEIIAAQIPVNAAVVSELRFFNKPDNELVKDTIRFKVGHKKT